MFFRKQAKNGKYVYTIENLNIKHKIKIRLHGFHYPVVHYLRFLYREIKNVELLDITIDKDLKFDKHVSKICSKANRKPNVLSRMRSFLSVLY